MYLEHYHPTAEKMRNICREEFVTSNNEWDPSKLDDIESAADLHIQQFSLLPLMLPIVSTTHNETFVQTKVIWKMIILSVTHQIQVVEAEEEGTVQNLEKEKKGRKGNG